METKFEKVLNILLITQTKTVKNSNIKLERFNPYNPLTYIFLFCFVCVYLIVKVSEPFRYK